MKKNRPFLLPLLLAACLCASAWCRDAAERAAQAGELVEIKGQRVLRLFGKKPKERGFAHGYLLAESIRDDTDAALASLPLFSADKYENRLRPWATKKFVWEDEALAELTGIFDGLVARLGQDQLELKTLKRALTLDDLKAINVVADYFGPACSAFSVAAKQTAELGVLQARTLDFPIGPKAVKDQILVVSETLGSGANARRAWVAVGWPGLIVQFSGMNADGLVVCIHDAYNVLRANMAKEGFQPRGWLLRRLLERIDPAAGDAAGQAAELAGVRPLACGNMFHLTWPSAAAEQNGGGFSVVVELDCSPRPPDLRRSEDGSALVVTNHFMLRNKPLKCERYTQMSEAVQWLEKEGKPIGLIEARKVLMAAEKSVAAHSIYFLPDKLELHVAISQDNVMSPRVAPTAFALKELFKGREK